MEPIQPTWSVRPEYRQGGASWVTFAGVLLFLVGLLNVFQGLLLVTGDGIYVTGDDPTVVVIADTATWGWIILILGALEMAAGGGVMSRNQLARWFGVFVACLALLGQFPVFFGSHPLWSLVVVLLCVLVIYGLVVHGGSESAPNDTIMPSNTPGQ